MSATELPAELVARLRAVVAGELDVTLPPAVSALVQELRQRWGDAVRAMLFYGSCLRQGGEAEGLVDLYVLVDSYRRAYRRRLPRLANRLLPPNVYYVEAGWDGRRVRAKCALLELAQFERLTAPVVFNPYFWARFAQPTGLAFVAGGMRGRIETALARAVASLYLAARPLSPAQVSAEDFWTRAFRATYATELRPERPERARELVARYPERYRRLFALLEAARLPLMDRARAERAWQLRRLQGKLLSVLRLSKAAFTFAGGPDYLAWKIERHSGVPVELSPFHRRHPFLAALQLGVRLYRARAFR